MKFTVAVLLLATLACTEALNAYYWCTGEFLKDTIKKCTDEHGTTKVEIDDFLYIRPGSTPKSPCFRACIFQECLLFNKRGNFLRNVPETTGYLASRRNPFHREIAEIAARTCFKKVPPNTDKCEATELFYSCIAETSPITLSFVGAYNLKKIDSFLAYKQRERDMAEMEN
ncbi:uncharacterized protein LOC142229883 [Haematobia irritans]|uniref:uncharacterized protein LOC142229883 n=1 Tax=Haematobia irritans TaxID=7368 RepID=UPI003F5008EB